MRVIVTCGPAHAPIDQVRRITNFSSGRLGVELSNALSRAGHSVLCLKGELATTQVPLLPSVKCVPFSTNDDLAGRLQLASTADVVLHAAALCDYEVDTVTDATGAVQTDAKIPSRSGGLMITLKPARKILPLLREVFPKATIVGWKYELNGTREDAVAAGARQIAEARVDLCVVNGAAYGDGFGLLAPDGSLRHVEDTAALCAEFVRRFPTDGDRRPA